MAYKQGGYAPYRTFGDSIGLGVVWQDADVPKTNKLLERVHESTHKRAAVVRDDDLGHGEDSENSADECPNGILGRLIFGGNGDREPCECAYHYKDGLVLVRLDGHSLVIDGNRMEWIRSLGDGLHRDGTHRVRAAASADFTALYHIDAIDSQSRPMPMKSDGFFKVVSASVLGSMLSVEETVAFGGGHTKSRAVDG